VLRGWSPHGPVYELAFARRNRCGNLSAPSTWKEVEGGKVGPATFTLRNMPARVAKPGDVWADMRPRGRSLTKAVARLRRLTEDTNGI
jgi:DNA primase